MSRNTYDLFVPDADANDVRWYGQWAGNERGVREIPAKCVFSVMSTTGSPISRQCSRKRGFGPEGEFCRQHARKFGARA